MSKQLKAWPNHMNMSGWLLVTSVTHGVNISIHYTEHDLSACVCSRLAWSITVWVKRIITLQETNAPVDSHYMDSLYFWEQIDHKRPKGTCFSVLASIQHVLFRGNSAAIHLWLDQITIALDHGQHFQSGVSGITELICHLKIAAWRSCLWDDNISDISQFQERDPVHTKHLHNCMFI